MPCSSATVLHRCKMFFTFWEREQTLTNFFEKSWYFFILHKIESSMVRYIIHLNICRKKRFYFYGLLTAFIKSFKMSQKYVPLLTDSIWWPSWGFQSILQVCRVTTLYLFNKMPYCWIPRVGLHLKTRNCFSLFQCRFEILLESETLQNWLLF